MVGRWESDKLTKEVRERVYIPFWSPGDIIPTPQLMDGTRQREIPNKYDNLRATKPERPEVWLESIM